MTQYNLLHFNPKGATQRIHENMKSGEQLHNVLNKTTFQVSRVFTGPFL